MRRTTCGCLTLVLLLLVVACGGESANRDDTPTPPVNYATVETSVHLLQARFPEATDTAVRDRVLLGVYCAVVEGEPLPTDYAMFSAEGDREVEAIVRNFVNRAESSLVDVGKAGRIAALWGASWKRDFYVTARDCENL